MTQVHLIVAWAVIGVFTVGWMWGLTAWIRRREPGEGFWVWLTVAQVTAALQVAIGLLLLLLGRRPLSWLHLVYGVGPLLVLATAHGISRDLQRQDEDEQPATLSPWMLFAGASFVCFALALRGLMTGFGRV
jgi:hypothetical protein